MSAFDPALLPENMQSKILPSVNGCWEWIGALNSRGYSSVGNGKGSSVLAHRLAYEIIVGPIPDGLTIDHLCRNKPCVNTDHLEPVTVAENNRRAARLQTHCSKGHPLSGQNLYLRRRKHGWVQRVCRKCNYEHGKAWRARKRAAMSGLEGRVVRS